MCEIRTRDQRIKSIVRTIGKTQFHRGKLLHRMHKTALFATRMANSFTHFGCGGWGKRLKFAYAHHEPNRAPDCAGFACEMSGLTLNEVYASKVVEDIGHGVVMIYDKPHGNIRMSWLP